jgi:hypothetical protein
MGLPLTNTEESPACATPPPVLMSPCRCTDAMQLFSGLHCTSSLTIQRPCLVVNEFLQQFAQNRHFGQLCYELTKFFLGFNDLV